jgi:hypothetical protein
LETAKALLGKLNPFQSELMQGKGLEKKTASELIATVAPIILYLFGFRKSEEKPKNGEIIEIPEIPKIPEKKEDLKAFFIQSLAQKESSAKPGEAPLDEKNQVRPYFHYANFDTIPTMSAKYKLGSTELFKDGLPATLQEFRQFLVSHKPPIEIQDLGKCAIGKYQIIPYWHFARMGWNWKNVEDVYNFMKDPSKQEALMANMAENYYEICNGDFTAMAICHYAGPNRAKEYLRNENAGALKAEQFKGYPSIMQYANAVAANMKSIQGG